MKTVIGVVLAMVTFALAATPAPAPKRPVTHVYHGTSVVDDYEWLENFDDPAVRKWNDEQNAATRAYLSKLPAKAVIAKRLKELYSATSADYFGLQYRRGRLFAMKAKPPAQQPWLVLLKSVDDLASERVVLDPNKLDAQGRIAIDFVEASLDGKKIAVSLSEDGSEVGTLHFYDVESGKQIGETIPHVNGPTAGGSVAWNAEGSGVYYTRYPRKGDRSDEDLDFYQQVYFHELGKPVEEDRYELGKELPRIAEIELNTSRDGKYVVAVVANGDGGDYAFYVHGPDGKWKQIAKFEDGVKHASFGADEALYLMSRKDAPMGKILRLKKPELGEAKVVVPESDGVIEGYAATAKGIYVNRLVGGPSELKFYPFDGSAATQISWPNPSAVHQMVWLEGDELLFKTTTYVDPYIWSKLDVPAEQLLATKMKGDMSLGFGGVQVVRGFATSKDGTKVPMNILRRRGTKLDGKNPTLLTAYGGYGISLSPSFDLGNRVWFDQGGVVVIANLRGGGEFGEAWHKAGNLTKKQNVFDDFLACAQWLIDNKYCDSKHLVIEGGSNGGLLMGAALTQRPDLFAAVVSHVGIYDSLRTELEPNGEFNVTEFGTVKDREQFKALYAYSPYHHVVDGTKYPPVLLTSGDNDGRVNPWQSRKMAARLAAANQSEHPILLRTTSTAGHGIGTSLDERIDEEADVYGFLFDQLGMKIK
ncbi:MAG TPA: prolyl oligopeptidase family serine peptidase [Tepidisphaeraceae bacterium]|jgi:prolyl oligopeptidase|nr:prolyl oligopeptidase family serine peptidase [Tepidisphaeraceae bacterium]